MPAHVEALLSELAQHPAAPFHEARVSAVIQQRLGQSGVPFHTDSYGNVIAHYRQGQTGPALALVAHMDHPAFEVVDGRDGAGTAELRGGVSSQALRPGTPLRLFVNGSPQAATIAEGPQPDKREGTFFSIATDGNLAAGDWGVWEMADFEVAGDLLRLRAADDLAGCAIILATLHALAEAGATANVYGVFTRAEEVGLVGATLVAQERRLAEDTIVISLESSRALPGAEQGAGPVIRVGDARRTFSAQAEAVLHAGLEHLRQTHPDFAAQRRLMSGGTCEATAFGLYGYATTGIALPLGNYHNVTDDMTLAPEYIHRADLEGAAALVLASVQRAGAPAVDGYRERLERIALRWGPRLKGSA